MNEAVLYKSLPLGASYYLDHAPGNAYRKVDEKTGEFIKHRLNSSWNGCKLMMGPSIMVRRQPFNPKTDAPLPPDPCVYHAPPAGPKCMLCDAPCIGDLCVACGGEDPNDLLS